MTDVYVALRRLKRKGKPARLLQDRHKRSAPTFDRTWSEVDRIATMFPERVQTRGGASA